MESHNTYLQDKTNLSIRCPSKGFTLIETIIAIGILGLILGLGLLATFDSFRGYMFRSERSTLVSILSRARNESLANINQISHGVCYDNPSHSYTIFQGAGYVYGAPENVVIEGSAVTTISAPSIFFCTSNSGIVFSQLAGTTTPVDIVVTQSNRTSTISINYEGTINW